MAILRSQFIVLSALLVALLVWQPGYAGRGKRNATTQGDPAIANRMGYQPLDAYAVDAFVKGHVVPMTDELTVLILKEASDEIVRTSIRQLYSSAGVETGFFGSARHSNHSYELTMDFTKTLTIGLMFMYNKDAAGNYFLYPYLTEKDDEGKPLIKGTVPIFIGVGVRITATITENSGNISVNLSQLGAKGDAKKIRGNLIMQTMGMSGETVTSSMPMPNEINSTTIQTALLAAGSIKAKMYDPKTDKRPRVVGFYNSIGGGDKFVTALISFIQLYRPAVVLQ